MFSKPKPDRFTQDHFAVLWTVWCLNVGAVVAFASVLPEQFRAVRDLAPDNNGLMILIVPSVVATLVSLWNSFES